MSHWKKILGFLISFLFLWLALQKVEWSKIPPILQSARPEMVLLMCVCMASEYLFRGWRWMILLDRPGVAYGSFVAGWLLGALFNNLFPARAGEFVRSFYLGRKNGFPASQAFGSIVLERFLDGVVVLTFVTISFSLFPINDLARKGAYTATFFYAMVFLFLIAMQYCQSQIDRLLQLVLRPLPAHWQTRILSTKDSFVKGLILVKSPLAFVRSIVISYAAWTLSVITIWVALQVFSLGLGVKEALLLISFLSLGAMIPSSPGMIGIFEYCCVLALHQVLGLSREVAVTTGLFLHFLPYLLVLIAGGSLMFYENLSWKDLERSSSPEAGETPAA